MPATNVHHNNSLTIRSSELPEEVRLEWSGRSTDRDPGRFIVPVLQSALQSALNAGKALVLDFRTIDFMNSSTFTPIVRMLDDARRSGCKVQLVYRKDVKWQLLSFTALKVFETNDRMIELLAA